MKYTDWFDSSVKPVHVGIYERRFRALARSFSYWDGKHWSTCEDFDDVIEWKHERTLFPHLSWRGLAVKP